MCDSAAAELCPVWPGAPLTAHWGVPDPAALEGTDAEKRQAFREAFSALSERIDRFLALPVDKLERPALKRKLAEIGGR